jgi:hypothetical protein
MILNEFMSEQGRLHGSNEKLPSGVLARVTYNICNIGETNANNRLYEQALWEKVLSDKELQRKLESRTLYGHAEHPKESASDLQLTSHVIHRMWIDENENKVYQTFDILDTPCGRIVNTLLEAGCQVGCSTRAEGDLEEVKEGDTSFKRVVPESYKYITTDTTADPSTFDAVPLDVKRNIINAVRNTAESNESKPGEKQFAHRILESMRCNHKNKCQNCGACKCLKGQEPKMNKSTVAEQIKSGKLTEGKAVTLTIKTKIGEMKYTKASVKKITEGRMDIVVTTPDGSNKMLTVEGSDKVTIRSDGSVDVFASAIPAVPSEDVGLTGTEVDNAGEMAAENPPLEDMKGPGSPEAEKEEEMSPFESKIAENSDVVAKNLAYDKKFVTWWMKKINAETPEDRGDRIGSPDKLDYAAAQNLIRNGSDDWLKSELRQYKRKTQNESKIAETVEGLTSLVVCPHEDEEGQIEYRLCGVFEGEPEPITLIRSADKSEIMQAGKNIASLTKVPFESEIEGENDTEDQREAGSEDELEDQWSRSSPKGIPNESKVDERYEKTQVIRYEGEEGWFVVLPAGDEYGPGSKQAAIKIAQDYEGEEGIGYIVINKPRKKVTDESKVDEDEFVTADDEVRLLKLFLRVEKEKNVNYGEAVPIVARMIDRTPEETDQLVNQALSNTTDRIAAAQNAPRESKVTVPPLDALIDLRIKEACTRAERDTLLEASKSQNDVQIRVMSKKLQTAATEIIGLRTMVEKKASQVVEAKKISPDVKKLNEKISVQHTAHQQELVKTASNSICEGRIEVLKDYFDRRLSACRLEADDNTQALLEKCQSLGDVDQLIESLVQVAQRGALHPQSLRDVVVRGRSVDPEQDKVDKQVGGLMKNWM